MIAAASSGHLDAVQYAFEIAPDVKSATEKGTTVLHAALTNTAAVSTPEDICAVIQFLAEKGADLNAADASGKTPLILAGPVDGAAALIQKLSAANGAAPKDASKQQ
jgi:ankyrin repeat protein